MSSAKGVGVGHAGCDQSQTNGRPNKAEEGQRHQMQRIKTRKPPRQKRLVVGAGLKAGLVMDPYQKARYNEEQVEQMGQDLGLRRKQAISLRADTEEMIEHDQNGRQKAPDCEQHENRSVLLRHVPFLPREVFWPRMAICCIYSRIAWPRVNDRCVPTAMANNALPTGTDRSHSVVLPPPQSAIRIDTYSD